MEPAQGFGTTQGAAAVFAGPCRSRSGRAALVGRVDAQLAVGVVLGPTLGPQRVAGHQITVPKAEAHCRSSAISTSQPPVINSTPTAIIITPPVTCSPR